MKSDLENGSKSNLWELTLTALGVVFGDIATSPLYALRECFSDHYGLPLVRENVLGVLGLIIWSLIIVVSIKYILFVLRANNKGEGGVLALLALALPSSKIYTHFDKFLIFVGIFGAALLYGDGAITPAVSVLSAVEGLNIAAPGLQKYVIFITIGILTVLFYFQKIGTSRIGFIFGPIILVYLLTLTILGLPQIFYHPEILSALNPYYAFNLFQTFGSKTLLIFGSIFLAVTGCEALYADMGHFGRRPISFGWTYVVFPALVINYLGQGAILIDNPANIKNPFFQLAPYDWALMPLVIIATLAAIVASQALISGVYSLTSQAIQLGYCPRLEIVYTSSEEKGQIYIPTINWALMALTIWLVLEFKSSSEMAGAYGIAVSLTMIITTLLVLTVAYRNWHWKVWQIVAACVPLVIIDMTFLGANMVKLLDGGWVPLAIGGAIFTLMTTWKSGRENLTKHLKRSSQSLEKFIEENKTDEVFHVKGTAVFLTADLERIPPALVRNVHHNKVLHERIVILSLNTIDEPRVPRIERTNIQLIAENMFRVHCNFGFMETPTIQEVLESLKLQSLHVELSETTFFLGRETLVTGQRPGVMWRWRSHLFSFMLKSSYRATQFFKIPPEQVIEIGGQIEI